MIDFPELKVSGLHICITLWTNCDKSCNWAGLRLGQSSCLLLLYFLCRVLALEAGSAQQQQLKFIAVEGRCHFTFLLQVLILNGQKNKSCLWHQKMGITCPRRGKVQLLQLKRITQPTVPFTHGHALVMLLLAAGAGKCRGSRRWDDDEAHSLFILALPTFLRQHLGLIFCSLAYLCR